MKTIQELFAMNDAEKRYVVVPLYPEASTLDQRYFVLDRATRGASDEYIEADAILLRDWLVERAAGYPMQFYTACAIEQVDEWSAASPVCSGCEGATRHATGCRA